MPVMINPCRRWLGGALCEVLVGGDQPAAQGRHWAVSEPVSGKERGDDEEGWTVADAMLKPEPLKKKADSAAFFFMTLVFRPSAPAQCDLMIPLVIPVILWLDWLHLCLRCGESDGQQQKGDIVWNTKIKKIVLLDENVYCKTNYKISKFRHLN